MTEHTERRLKLIERMLQTSERIKEIANEFSLLVNCGIGGAQDDFVEYFKNSEVANQITEIAIGWLQTCADQYYRTDSRNVASKTVAQELLSTINTEDYVVGETVKKICLDMEGDHRTLQQSFTRMMVKWLYNQNVISQEPNLPYV